MVLVLVLLLIFYLFISKRAEDKCLLSAHKEANKKFFCERCDSNISFAQKEGSKIVLVDEAGESTVGYE